MRENKVSLQWDLSTVREIRRQMSSGQLAEDYVRQLLRLPALLRKKPGRKDYRKA